MKQIILSSAAVVIVAMISITLEQTEPLTSNHLTQAEQVEIYKQAMDRCVTNE